jgi:hypothetical protein
MNLYVLRKNLIYKKNIYIFSKGGEYQEKSDKLKKIVAQYNNLNNAVKEMGE